MRTLLIAFLLVALCCSGESQLDECQCGPDSGRFPNGSLYPAQTPECMRLLNDLCRQRVDSGDSGSPRGIPP